MINTSHFDLLGKKVEDAVTGYKGVVTTISYDLYGCIQAVVTPEADGQDISPGGWFDVTRLIVKSKKPVMALPDYNQGYVSEGRKGAASKPLP